jgi:hypothetical protein
VAEPESGSTLLFSVLTFGLQDAKTIAITVNINALFIIRNLKSISHSLSIHYIKYFKDPPQDYGLSNCLTVFAMLSLRDGARVSSHLNHNVSKKAKFRSGISITMN